MKTASRRPRCFEFCFPYLDTQVRVDDYGDTVEVRATRDTFSPERKAAFVRSLVAEGFIDESFRWFPVAGRESFLGVNWRVDFSWLEIPGLILRRARNFMVGLQVGTFVTWTVMMAVLLLGR